MVQPLGWVKHIWEASNLHFTIKEAQSNYSPNLNNSVRCLKSGRINPNLIGHSLIFLSRLNSCNCKLPAPIPPFVHGCHTVEFNAQKAKGRQTKISAFYWRWEINKDNYVTEAEMGGSRKDHMMSSTSEGIHCFPGSAYYFYGHFGFFWCETQEPNVM